MKNIRQTSIALICLLAASLPQATALAQSAGSFTSSAKENVRIALSAFEVSQSLTQLESIAGGKDALVSILLTLRNDDETRFVSTRSEQLLLSYADRPEVLSVLKDDLGNADAPGHAIAIVTHIDSVPSVGPRRELAKSSIARAERDVSFHPFVRMLTMNDDVEIQKSAKAINLQ